MFQRMLIFVLAVGLGASADASAQEVRAVVLGRLLDENDPQIRKDRHGDPLPPGAIARLGNARMMPPDGVSFLSFSPDGKTIASVGYGSVSLWECTTGRLKQSIDTGRGQSTQIRFALDSKTFVRGGEKILRFWNVSAGDEQRNLAVPVWASYLDLSLDGSMLASMSAGDPTHVCETATGKQLGQLPWEGSYFVALHWVPGTKTLAVFCLDRDSRKGYSFRLWDVSTGKVRRVELPQLKNPLDFLYEETPCIAFALDGKTFALGVGAIIYLIDLTTGKELGQLRGHRYAIAHLVFSADGRHLASTAASTVEEDSARIWRVADRRQIAALANTNSESHTLAFSPDGKTLATYGNDNAIHLWDVASGKERLPMSAAVREPVTPLCFTPDGKTLLVGGKTEVQFWDVNAAEETRARLKIGETGILSVSPDRRFLAVGRWDQGLHVLDIATGKQLADFPPPDDRISGAHYVAISPDGKTLASGIAHAVVNLYDVASWKKSFSFEGQSTGVCGLVFAPDSKTIVASRGDGRLVGWEVASGKQVVNFEYQFSGCHCFSSDGKILAAAGVDGVVRLIEVATGKQRGVHSSNLRMIQSIAYSTDQTILAVCGINGIVLWDMPSGKEVWRLKDPTHSLTSLVFSPDGKRFAVGSNDTSVLIWDTATCVSK